MAGVVEEGVGGSCFSVCDGRGRLVYDPVLAGGPFVDVTDLTRFLAGEDVADSYGRLLTLCV